MSRSQREERARERRRLATLRKTRLQAAEDDPGSVHGSEALSLVTRLTVESWSLSGREFPDYERAVIPCRFVPSRVP